MIISSKPNIHAHWQIGILIITFILLEIFVSDLNFTIFAKEIIKVTIILICVSIIGIGSCVKITRGKIKTGKCLGIPIIYKLEQEIRAKDIKEYKISQNAEHNFEIKAVTDDSEITLLEIANRKPAEEKLVKIKNLLTNAC